MPYIYRLFGPSDRGKPEMIASFVFDLDSTVLQGELLPAIGGAGSGGTRSSGAGLWNL